MSKTVIISDLHLGSKFCLVDQLIDFVEHLSPDTDLVLNGDVVDYRYRDYPENYNVAMDLLVKESYRRKIIWISGNHDNYYKQLDIGKIQRVSSLNIGKRVFVAHGNNFEHRNLFFRVFVICFRLFYELRMLMGGEPMHVAYFAKRYPRLYRVFRERVKRNAFNYAIAEGFSAVVCGHTHYQEEEERDGVIYFNTGSWTESPVYCVIVDDNSVKMRVIEKTENKL